MTQTLAPSATVPADSPAAVPADSPATVPAAPATRGARRPGPVVRNAAALMISTVGAAGLGFIFWVVAARFFPVDVVGHASALLAALTLLAALAQLNLVSLHARFLPDAGRRTTRMIVTGHAASIGTAVVLCAGFFGLGLGDGIVAGGWGPRLFFVLAVIASALFFIQDGLLAALRRAAWVPAKNGVAAAAKLALLPILAGAAAGVGVYLAWVLPILIMVAVVGWWIFARLAPAHARLSGSSAAPRPRGEVARFVSAEYLNGIISNAVSFVPPLLVATVLGNEASAFFYIPWLVGVSATTLMWNIVTSFVVESSRDGAQIRAHLHRAVRLGLLVIVPATTILVTLATPLMSVLGPAYATHGTTALRLIGLSLPFTGIILLYSAFCVMAKRMWALAVIQSAGAVVFLAGSWLGLTRLGLVAPALAYLIVQAVIGLALLPTVIKRYRAIAGDRVTSSDRVIGAPA